MTFPIIQYKATNVEINAVWQDLVEQKFKSLEKYIGNETGKDWQLDIWPG